MRSILQTKRRQAAFVAAGFVLAVSLGCSSQELNAQDAVESDSDVIECVCPESELPLSGEGIVVDLTEDVLVIEEDGSHVVLRISGYDYLPKEEAVRSALEGKGVKVGDRVLVSYYRREGGFFLSSLDKFD